VLPATTLPSTTTTLPPATALGTAPGPTTDVIPGSSSSSAASAAPSSTTLPLPPPAAGASAARVAVAFAESQIGKPYQWGGAGPNSYDCSGLVMVAWGRAGVSFPHSAQDQYDMTERVSIADLQPGDLVFYGTPNDVYHVGIYIGNGQMVDAPETGEDVKIQSIYELNLLGGGRPR